MKDNNGNIFGKNVSVYRDVIVRNSEIGDKTLLADDCFITNSKIGSYGKIERRSMIFNAKLGTCVNVGFNAVIRNCQIGDYTVVAWNVSVGAGEHNQHAITMRPFPYDKWYDFITEEEEAEFFKESGFDYYAASLILGNDVWQGAVSQVLRGVQVADGAILGAGCVVTKDVGPYEIWAGVPAKKIGQRFSDEIISELLELQWWKWPKEFIKKNIKYFQRNVDLEMLKDLKEEAATLLENE